MRKEKIKDAIHLCGEASNDVTGSIYYLTFGDKKILLECGLYQSSANSYLDSYRINSQKFKFNPSKIDYVFVGHAHIDHTGLIPRLVKEGFKGKIITTGKTSKIMEKLLLNSAFILKEEARILSLKYGRNYDPIYEEQHVHQAIKQICVCDKYNQVIKLDDTVSFRFIENGHCIGAVQIDLMLDSKTKHKRILYTSDLGAFNPVNSYVTNTPIPKNRFDYVLMESTYGSKPKQKYSRKKELKYLKQKIEETLSQSGTVIFPCFSFSRTQELMTVLHEMFNEQEGFNANIYIDSLLSCEITQLYEKIVGRENMDQWEKVISWNHFKLIRDKKDSIPVVSDPTPKIILTSSGFCTNGRVIDYLKTYLGKDKNLVVFTGYTGDNDSYLSYKINQRPNQKISIFKSRICNQAKKIVLSSFSSHMPQAQLLQYGSELETNALILVHGSEESKANLQEQLIEKISKMNKSFKVFSSCKNQIYPL